MDFQQLVKLMEEGRARDPDGAGGSLGIQGTIARKGKEIQCAAALGSHTHRQIAGSWAKMDGLSLVDGLTC